METKILELISSIISEGNNLLLELDTMRKQDRSTLIIAYANEDVERLRKGINKWQLTAKEILINVFGESHRFVSLFENTITRKNQGFDFKREYKYEINRGMEILESIEEMLKLEQDKFRSVNGENQQKKPMVFISHSSKDKEFVVALVDLLETLGFNSSNLFCSSVDGYGIGLSEDIFETLRSLFNEHNLFVIFIHSPRYYKSVVSLNEMGAAWVLRTNFCSFLTTDMEFEKMSGVVNGNSLSIKVDNENAFYRLTELKNKLIKTFELNDIDSSKWERKCNKFLEIVTAIEYPSENVNTQPEDKSSNAIKTEVNEIVTFNEQELQLFSRWANNAVDTSYVAVYTRNGLEVHFGYQNCYVFQRGQQQAELEDYMERLLHAGYIKISHFDNKHNLPIYSITKQGYDFAKSLL